MFFCGCIITNTACQEVQFQFFVCWILVGVRFSVPIHTSHGVDPASYTIGTDSFPGEKWAGSGIDHQLLPSAEVKERVELYL